MIPAQCDVAIVGADPSGLMVATELALAGVDVVVLERRGEPALPRAGTLASRVLEIFDSRGLAGPVLTRAFELHEDPRATVGISAGFHGVRFDRLDSTFPYVLMFAQMEVERILAARATELGARIVRLAAVTGLTQHDDHVRIEVEQAGGAGDHRGPDMWWVRTERTARSGARPVSGDTARKPIARPSTSTPNSIFPSPTR